MDNELSPQEIRVLRNLLDIKQGGYMVREDFLCYLWLDQIPKDSRPNLGIPLPLDEELLKEMNRSTSEERANIQENLIIRYMENYRVDYESGEALRRLLVMLIKHEVEIPEALTLWAYAVAVALEPDLREGRRRVGNLDDRICEAFLYLVQYKNYDPSQAYKIIAELANKSSEAIRSSIRRTYSCIERILSRRGLVRVG